MMVEPTKLKPRFLRSLEKTSDTSEVAGMSFIRLKAFFWGFAFHHYYLDSKIWHASEDAELRQILGFQGPKKPAPPEPLVSESSAPLTAKVSEAG